MAKSSVRVCGAFPKAQRALIQFCTPLALVFPRSHIFPRGNKSTWRSHSPSAAHPSLACRHEGTRPRGNMPRQHHSRSDPTVRSALGQAPTDKELREMISQVDVDQVRVPACRAAAIPENSTHGTFNAPIPRLNTWYVLAAYRALPPAPAAALVRERSIHPRSAPNRGVSAGGRAAQSTSRNFCSFSRGTCARSTMPRKCCPHSGPSIRSCGPTLARITRLLCHTRRTRRT